MDDIAFLTTSPEGPYLASLVIETFCQATGSQLNHSKCFILTPTPLPSPLERWEQANYVQKTDYLGTIISHEDDDNINWTNRLSKMGLACSKVKNAPFFSVRDQITLTNIFVISHIPYIACFSFIPTSLHGRLSNLIWKTLKGKNTLQNVSLYSNLGSFSLN